MNVWKATPALLLIAGCGRGIEFTGDLTQPVSGAVRQNVVYVPATVNGSPPHSLAIDTGAPVTLLDPNTFASAGVMAGHGQVSTLTVGAVTLKALSVEGLSPCGMMACAGDVLDGILGGNVLSSFAISLDYRGGRLSLEPFGAVDGVEAQGATSPFDLEGGGLGLLSGESTPIRFAATRIALTATVEGVEHPFVVDSGASLVVLRSSLFNSLLADGRGQQVVDPLTVMGLVNGSATRIRSMVIAGAEVTRAPAFQIGDTLLDALASEVGHPVDGLVGGTFLREFLVTIDYPGQKLTLRRYANEDHVLDEFDRVGFPLQLSSDGHYRTGTPFAGTDAATNPAVPPCFFGSIVTSIGGQSVDGVTSDEADRMLRGTVGQTRDVQVISHCDGSTVLDFTFRIDELLPLP